MAQAAQAKAQIADVIPIHSREDALAWGDGWQAQALRVQTQLERTQMLLFCAEVHEKASAILLEAYQDEILRLRELIK